MKFDSPDFEWWFIDKVIVVAYVYYLIIEYHHSLSRLRLRLTSPPPSLFPRNSPADVDYATSWSLEKRVWGDGQHKIEWLLRRLESNNILVEISQY